MDNIDNIHFFENKDFNPKVDNMVILFYGGAIIRDTLTLDTAIINTNIKTHKIISKLVKVD